MFALAISPDGRWLVTACHDKIARLWDLSTTDPASTLKELPGHEATLRCVAFDPDSRWVITGSSDNTVRFWDLDMDALLERARRLVGREMTPQERKKYMLDES